MKQVVFVMCYAGLSPDDTTGQFQQFLVRVHKEKVHSRVLLLDKKMGLKVINNILKSQMRIIFERKLFNEEGTFSEIFFLEIELTMVFKLDGNMLRI